jgi:hypothetical protein
MLFDILSLITAIIGACVTVLLLYLVLSKNYSIFPLILFLLALFVGGVAYCLFLIREGEFSGSSDGDCKTDAKINEDLKTINDYLITLAPHFHLVDKDMKPVTYSGIETCC